MNFSSNSNADSQPLRFLVLGAESASVRWLVAELLGRGVQADASELTRFECSPAARYDRQSVLLLGLPAHAQAHQLAADQALREALRHSGQTFQVLHGDAQTQLDQALRLATRPKSGGLPTAATSSMGGWQMMCEACSDPDCERRLFHALNTDRRPMVRPGNP